MTTNLQSLVWVRDEQSVQSDDSTEIAYAIDGVYVYRRVTDLTNDIPRPEYFRAEHREVLLTNGNWSDVDGSIWQPVTHDNIPRT